MVFLLTREGGGDILRLGEDDIQSIADALLNSAHELRKEADKVENIKARELLDVAASVHSDLYSRIEALL